MTGLGANVMYSLEQQANRLKPGSEIVIKMTQKELNKNLQWKLKDGSFFEYDPKKKQVIIYKPKKKNYKCAEEALNSWFDVKDAVDACSDKITISTDIPGLDQKLAEEKKQVAEEKKQVIKYERVALMNPSRELRDMVKAYNKELDKKHIDVDKFYKVVKEAHQAIVLPSSYIDSDTYKIFISSWWVKMIIWDLKKKLKEPYYKRYQKKINEIIKLLEDIDKKAKPKDYWLA